MSAASQPEELTSLGVRVRVMSRHRRTAWIIAYWTLLPGWLLGAALTMNRVRGGFLTNYLADILFPPWYYIVARGLASRQGKGPPLLRWFGHSPERAAVSIYLVGVVSELSQIWWPRGLFAGTFDPLDLVAYAVGLILCYACDKAQGGPSTVHAHAKLF